MRELSDVLFREKFDPYLTIEERIEFIDKIDSKSTLFKPTIDILECHDPKDNKFLELAITCDTACIISGDKDLSVLNSFRGIPILNASDIIKKF